MAKTTITPMVPLSAIAGGEAADQAGGGQGQQPAVDHLAGGAPADLGLLTADSGAEMEPAHTWVVDSPKPMCEDARMAAAEVVSAARPWAR